MSTRRRPAPGEPSCVKCGATRDLRQAEFTRNIGLVFMRLSETHAGLMCPPCVQSTFWSCTLVTLVAGWWGFLSFFLTPAIVLANCVSLARASKRGRWLAIALPLAFLGTIGFVIWWTAFKPPPPAPLTPALARSILAGKRSHPRRVEAEAYWAGFLAKSRAAAGQDPLALAVVMAAAAGPQAVLDVMVELKNEIPPPPPRRQGNLLVSTQALTNEDLEKLRQAAVGSLDEFLRRPFNGERLVACRLSSTPRGASLIIRLLPDGDAPGVLAQGELKIAPDVHLKGEGRGTSDAVSDQMRRDLGLDLLGPDYEEGARAAIGKLFAGWTRR